jgi:hypothetical protein
MHTKRIKNVTPLHLYIAYLSGFKRGGRGRGVCNIICRSLFHYYSDLFYYSTMFPSTPHYASFIYFLLREREG